MQGSASREGSEGRGSDGRGGDAAPTTSEPTGLDLDNSLDDALSSPPVPAAPEPHAALAVLCRKAAAEAVSSIKISRKLQPREGGESSTNDIEESSDLETTLALGRLALVLSSSSSSSSSSSPPPTSYLREEYAPLLNAALAASVARGALGHALVGVCRRARTQDGASGPDSLGAVALEAEQLLDAGAPLEFSTEHGDTLLTVAAGGGSPQLVRMLLRRGADPKGSRGACTPPIHAAIEGALVDAFGQRFGSHDECVRLLLEAGADPRARDVPPGRAEEVKRREGGDLNGHWSALHRAALRGLPAVCSLLLASPGVEPDVAGPCGQTPLDLAVYRRHREVVEVLRGAGAKGRKPRAREESSASGAVPSSSSSRGCVVS